MTNQPYGGRMPKPEWVGFVPRLRDSPGRTDSRKACSREAAFLAKTHRHGVVGRESFRGLRSRPDIASVASAGRYVLERIPVLQGRIAGASLKPSPPAVANGFWRTCTKEYRPITVPHLWDEANGFRQDAAHSSFGLRASFVIRHSSLVIRYSAFRICRYSLSTNDIGLTRCFCRPRAFGSRPSARPMSWVK